MQATVTPSALANSGTVSSFVEVFVMVENGLLSAPSFYEELQLVTMEINGAGLSTCRKMAGIFLQGPLESGLGARPARGIDTVLLEGPLQSDCRLSDSLGAYGEVTRFFAVLFLALA